MENVRIIHLKRLLNKFSILEIRKTAKKVDKKKIIYDPLLKKKAAGPIIKIDLSLPETNEKEELLKK